MSQVTALPSVAAGLAERARSGASAASAVPLEAQAGLPATTALAGPGPGPGLPASPEKASLPSASLATSATTAVTGPSAAPAGAPAGAEQAAQRETDKPSPYSARTSFDAATGEWALVIERHPPEVGITIAEQRGFVSQYLARVSSASGLLSAYTTHI